MEKVMNGCGGQKRTFQTMVQKQRSVKRKKAHSFLQEYWTGTPGVGKSTLCYELAKQTNFEWLEVGKIAKEHQCYESYDDEYQCPILDEDKLGNLSMKEGRDYSLMWSSIFLWISFPPCIQPRQPLSNFDCSTVATALYSFRVGS
ncbi:Adenylate kinase isoenzyme 6 [Homalodisca vitripennis]|nr:Adenylate kinase isoenzyme 6 [Homalodisca vitripennis]